jgi:hypothetical protein
MKLQSKGHPASIESLVSPNKEIFTQRKESKPKSNQAGLAAAWNHIHPSTERSRFHGYALSKCF